MRVLVCGGRKFSDARSLYARLDELAVGTTVTALIHGDAPGAGRLAHQWAYERHIPINKFPADWNAGRSAGPKHNQRMIDEGKPDLVIAFAGGRDTADMVVRAKLAGARVVTVE